MEVEDTAYHKKNHNKVDSLQKTVRRKKENRIDSNHSFEPSMKLLSRITKVILESNSVGKTSLSQEANINYHTLAKHLDWLEKKHLVESVIEDHKVKLRLTENGRQFTTLFYNLDVTL